MPTQRQEIFFSSGGHSPCDIASSTKQTPDELREFLVRQASTPLSLDSRAALCLDGAMSWATQSHPFSTAVFSTHHVWLSHDPIGERGGVNVMGFVGNTSMNRLDVFGLDDLAGDDNGPFSLLGWSSEDFVLWFYIGDGHGVNLDRVRLLDDYQAARAVKAFQEQTRGQIQHRVDEYKGCCEKGEAFFLKTASELGEEVFVETIFAMSNGRISHYTRCECTGDNAFICLTTFYGTDEFKDPLNKDHWNGGFSLFGRVQDWWPDFLPENLGGSPYFIFANWGEEKVYW